MCASDGRLQCLGPAQKRLACRSDLVKSRYECCGSAVDSGIAGRQVADAALESGNLLRDGRSIDNAQPRQTVEAASDRLDRVRLFICDGRQLFRDSLADCSFLLSGQFGSALGDRSHDGCGIVDGVHRGRDSVELGLDCRNCA